MYHFVNIYSPSSSMKHPSNTSAPDIHCKALALSTALTIGMLYHHLLSAFISMTRRLGPASDTGLACPCFLKLPHAEHIQLTLCLRYTHVTETTYYTITTFPYHAAHHTAQNSCHDSICSMTCGSASYMALQLI